MPRRLVVEPETAPDEMGRGQVNTRYLEPVILRPRPPPLAACWTARKSVRRRSRLARGNVCLLPPSGGPPSEPRSPPRFCLDASTRYFLEMLTTSCRRPFRRRRFSTSRPALVLIRLRNPWVRLRLLRWGWNVRFTGILRALCHPPSHREAGAGPRVQWGRCELASRRSAVNAEAARLAPGCVWCTGRICILIDAQGRP
jgi:hypothetical protein